MKHSRAVHRLAVVHAGTGDIAAADIVVAEYTGAAHTVVADMPVPAASDPVVAVHTAVEYKPVPAGLLPEVAVHTAVEHKPAPAGLPPVVAARTPVPAAAP